MIVYRNAVYHVADAPAVTINDIDFANVEPEPGDDYIVPVRVTFTVGGRDLARLLGKQERVLGRYLEKVSSREVINAVRNSDAILVALRRPVSNFVREYFMYDLGEEYVAKAQVDWVADEPTDLPFTAKIDSRNQTATVEVELDVMSV